MTNQPIINAAVITSVVGAFIALLTAFGIPITAEQQAAIMSLFAILAPFLVAWIANGKTTPLSNPRDATGAELTRFDGTPAKTSKESPE